MRKKNNQLSCRNKMMTLNNNQRNYKVKRNQLKNQKLKNLKIQKLKNLKNQKVKKMKIQKIKKMKILKLKKKVLNQMMIPKMTPNNKMTWKTSLMIQKYSNKKFQKWKTTFNK